MTGPGDDTMKTQLMLGLALGALMMQACTPPAEKAEPDSDATAPAAAAPATAATITIDGEGLSIAAPGGAPTRFAFGAPQAQVISAFTAVQGAPADQGEQAECGAGPISYARWDGGTNLSFQNGAFAGYDTTDAALVTAEGIHAGSPRAQLDAASPGPIEETSLGQEFGLNGVFGILREDGVMVTTLFAGANCFAR